MTLEAQAAQPVTRPPLIQVKSTAFWCVIALAVLGLWNLRRDFLPVMATFPASAVINVLILALSLVVGMWLARRVMRPVQGPPWAGAWLAIAWGGLAACGLAIIANTALLSVWSKTLDTGASSWSAALTAPLNEETLKLAGVVMLAAVSTRLIRSAADGLVFGALVGLGFQVMENFTYGLNAIASVSGGVDPVGTTVTTLTIRILGTGFGSHWAMSAVAGAGIGYLVSASNRPPARRIGVAVGCWVLAMAMHWQFDSPLMDGGLLMFLKPVINLLVVMAVYTVVRRNFRARWDRIAAEEVAAGVMLPEEAQSLSRRRSRRKYLAGTLAGTPEHHTRAKVQRLELELIEDRMPQRAGASEGRAIREQIASARVGP